MAFFRLDQLMWFIVFSTPLSINLEELDIGGVGMYVPTEPLMFGVMLLFFFRLLLEKNFDSKIIKHPITLAIFVNLVWIAITSLTSEMPVVSLKFLLARVWFVVCLKIRSVKRLDSNWGWVVAELWDENGVSIMKNEKKEIQLTL